MPDRGIINDIITNGNSKYITSPLVNLPVFSFTFVMDFIINGIKYTPNISTVNLSKISYPFPFSIKYINTAVIINTPIINIPYDIIVLNILVNTLIRYV